MTASKPSSCLCLEVEDYDLAATLDSGQAFRWAFRDGAWEGVVHGHWVALRQVSEGIEAASIKPFNDWQWLEEYLQTRMDYSAVLASFPEDPVLSQAIKACRGLRLLRQEPWECLASFILSSTKQITQIRAIVELLSNRYGQRVAAPPDRSPQFAFPRPEVLAALPESELRACKMGFRARYLLHAAQQVASGQLDLAGLFALPMDEARAALMRVDGVGPKIADCVLLFALGFDRAFPVDVWIARVLREQYFPRRRPSPQRLAKFIANHFGPHAGYAQQYLFHYFRVVERK